MVNGKLILGDFFLLYREQSKFAFYKRYTCSVYSEIGTLNQSP